MLARAEALGGKLVEDAPLIDKLAAICEIPGVMEGKFGDAFLELPAEVLSTSLRDHQSALTVTSPDDEDRLLPYFLTVMDRPDDPIGRARSGNEWVVAARLADARFFYGEDRKQPSPRPPRSSSASPSTRSWGATRRRPSGSSPSRRRSATSSAGAPRSRRRSTPPACSRWTSRPRWSRSSPRCRGSWAASTPARTGRREEVWQAVYDQYMPASAEDRIPRGRVGQVVGLADRSTRWSGMFGLGLIPTGSKDPFGLRRAAQGVVRIVLEGGLAVDLEAVAAKAAAPLRRPPDAERRADPGRSPPLPRRPHPLHSRPRRAMPTTRSRRGWRRASPTCPTCGRAWTPSTRCARRPASSPWCWPPSASPTSSRTPPRRRSTRAPLVEPAEKDLAAAFAGLRADLEAAAAAGDYERGLRRIADLAPVLDRFFVDVMVMAEDEKVRRNRIALLQAIGKAVSRTARLTEMVVDKAEARAKAG